MKKHWQLFLAHIESATPAYTGRGETALALAVLPLAFLYKLLDCLYGRQPIADSPWLYMIVLSVFTAIAFSSVFFLATPSGERLIRRLVAKRHYVRLAVVPLLYIGIFILTLFLLQLPQLHSHALAALTGIMPEWPLILKLSIAGLIMSAGFYCSLRWSNGDCKRFGVKQLGLVLLAALPYLLLQEYLPIVWCFTTPIALIVMVYATGLGREYFGYSFVPRNRNEALGVVILLLCGLTLFLLFSLAAGTISYTGGLWTTAPVTLYDSIFVWLLIVGVSEEVIFRCGVLTLVASYCINSSGRIWRQHPRLCAVLITSALFALSHVFRGATLFFLSFLASLLYGLAFVAGKSLFGPVLLHGLLNVLVLMNFHLSDFK